MSFKLMLTLEEYNGFNPVYPLEVPKYLASEIGLSLEDYYTRAMSATQRLINSYMQNVLANNDWDVNKFDVKLREQIQYILFKEMEYLHQNQIFFKKSNSISYSTSGQQTFTFSPDADDLNESHIPQYVKMEIINTNLIKRATAANIEQYDYEQKNNEFKDKVLVPDVAWSDKADNQAAINGKTDSLENFIKYLYSTYVSIDSSDYQKLLTLADIFALNESSVLTRRKLTSNTYFTNKNENDFAQIKDLIETFYVSNNAISAALSQIGELSNNVNYLQDTKLDKTEFTTQVNNKANLDFSNVNLGTQNIPKFIQVSTNGEIMLKDTSGSLNPIIWTPEYDFIPGDFASVVVDPTRSGDNPKVRIFCALEANINKNPLTNPKLWAEYEINYEVIDSITKKEANRLFVRKENGELLSDLEANGFNINNPGNLITKEDLADDLIAKDKLWSSSKIVEYVNENAGTGNEGENTNTYKNTDGNLEVDNISNIINFKENITVDSLTFKNKLDSSASAIYDENGIDSNNTSFSLKLKVANEKVELAKAMYLKNDNQLDPKQLSFSIKYLDLKDNQLKNFDLVQDLYKLIKLSDDNELMNTKIDSLESLYNLLIEKLRTLRPFKDAGIYNPSSTYQKNEWVLKEGDIYVSRKDNNFEPLTDQEAWYHWDLAIDLSDLASQEALLQLKQELSQLITINEINIRNITDKVDKKQDKLTAGNHCEITSTGTINVIIPETIAPIAFRKGEIRMFDTQENVDELIKKYKLVQDTDFNYLETNRYLMTMDINKDNQDKVKGGSNLLIQSDFPNIKTGFRAAWNNMTDDPWTRDFKVLNSFEEIKPIEMTYNAPSNDGGRYNYCIGFEYWLNWNGNVDQTEFKPKYHGVVAIRFLKDIKEVSSEAN